MKILCMIPPYLPSYFNAGHHLPIFLVSAYLRKNLTQDDTQVDCYDCAALNYTWKEICNLLCKQYDVIVLLNDYDAVDTYERFMYYKHSISPQTKTITFGRLSKQIPGFFFQFGIDAVHASGDYELGVYQYVMHLYTPKAQIPGVLLSNKEVRSTGSVLDPNDWVLPDVTEIPYQAYSYMYKNDLNKFCGIPDRQELVLPIARGCPLGCSFCDVPTMQGSFERRLSVERTIDYIQKSFATLPFEYITFYAPTFTLNKKWVKSFCHNLLALKTRYSWKCVTVLKLLNEELIRLMSESGCIRISLGIESFTNTAAMKLPKLKQDTLDTFMNITQLCQHYHIELNCFIILGLPQDSPEEVQNTINICMQQGARVRPTIYTPYHLMQDTMSIAEVNRFNRQLFVPDYLPSDIAQRYYEIFYNNRADTSTRVMNNIPQSHQVLETIDA